MIFLSNRLFFFANLSAFFFGMFFNASSNIKYLFLVVAIIFDILSFATNKKN